MKLPLPNRKARSATPTFHAPRPGFAPEASQAELTHELGSVLEHLATIRRRRKLRRDPVYREVRSEIDRVLGGFEWRLSDREPGDGQRLRAVAWNVERGKRLSGIISTLGEHPELKDADIVMLNEVDIGMGRTGNVNVPRAVAEALGYDYVYANQELVLSPGDAFERNHAEPNTLALHGLALLTRLPITRISAVGIPEFRDKFHATEKRLGTKRALVCEVALSDGPLTVVVSHLDPFASPRHRGRQMRRIINHVDALGNSRVLLGGDLNTNTWDLGSKVGLFANLAHKLTRFGFDGTIRQGMSPERVFERSVFAAMRRAGLEVDGFNDRSRGTIYYDMNDPELRSWTEIYVPKPVQNYLDRNLVRWGGVIPLKVDWMAGRELKALSAAVVERPQEGRLPISDHNPLRVDVSTTTPRGFELPPGRVPRPPV
ncbi:MAG: endonuclease/exonuclease/phosphatase family protein [Deltaproteobacteria bacterium]|nr:endonuclease/exonuclease/phosphatase family protein [Deltaproteobacteria bacterium]